MEFKLFLIFFLKVPCFLSSDNYTMMYCMANDDQYGILITDGRGKDDYLTGLYSDYSDNTTVLSFSEYDNWKKWCSTHDKSPLNSPVFDKRWETIKNNRDHSIGFHNFFKYKLFPTVFFSVKTNRNISSLKVNQWNHLMLQNESFHICTGQNFGDCSNTISDPPGNFYSREATAMWKLHEYYYFYTNSTNVTEKIYENSESCDAVTKGCLTMYFAACSNCHMFLNITGGSEVRTQNITGTESWHTEKISLDNFTKCFTLHIITGTNDKTSDTKLFWAFGDVGYISINKTCDEIKRYIAVNSSEKTESVTCENSWNEKIEFSSVPFVLKEETKIENFSGVDDKKEPLKSSFFNASYLLIIILIPIITALGLIICHFIYKRKEKTENSYELEILKSTTKTSQSTNIDSRWPPQQRNDFLLYVEDLLNPNNKEIQKQFASLPKGYLKMYTHATKPENIAKNRFANLLPYDDKRVKLKKKMAGKFFSGDYINASYILGSSSYQEYIIAQSPLENTINDFWLMIWQKNIYYIIIITNEGENCHYYWPQKRGHPIAYADIKISLEEISIYQYYQERKFLVTKNEKTREMFQLHYHSWLDNDITALCKRMLPFISHLLKIPHYSSPVLFHSQDDVDPSGVVILCDIALRSLPVLGTVDVYSTAKMLRHCRVNTIASLEQYKLAYSILKLFLENGTMAHQESLL